MAKVRANASGNWSSTNTGIWEVYDEQTNTWSAYGQNPTSDDDVYHNGYNLTLMMSVNVKSITNHEDTNIRVNGGGRLIWNSGYTFTANTADYLMSGSTSAFSFGVNSTTTNCYIICSTIRIEGGVCFVHTYGNNAGFEVTGNIYIKNTNLASGGYGTYTHKLSVNGNIIGEGVNYFVKSYTSYNNSGWDFQINGDCKLVGDDKVNNLGRTRITITGCYRGLDNINLSFAQTTSTISLGSIEYYSTNHTYGFFAIDVNNKFTSSWGFTILNPSTFTWKDVTQPISNQFLLLTQEQLNNTNQYPSPANVKKDIPYAWGYMNGMMLPDYPQPANVLKDIEYGRHCAGRNDIVTYDNDRYVYVKTDGEYHWEIEHITSTDVTAVVDTTELSTAYKGVTTTDIVTNPTANPVIINGTSTNISTDQYVRYGHSVYKWNGSEWILYQTDPKNVPTISIDGASVTADDGYVVKYSGNDKYYMWDSTDIEWQEQTMNYLGETTTNVTLSPSPQYVTLPYSISENSYIGTLAIPNISDNLIQRLGQSVTVPILQQILDAHLN